MKFLKFIQYDVNEGIVRFWKRYLLVLLLGVTADVTTYRQAFAGSIRMSGIRI